MLFNSFEFLLIFLPVTLGMMLLAQRIHPRVAKGWIATASLAFYAWWSLSFVWILMASITVNYGLLRLALGAPLGSRMRKAVVVAGACVNIGLLAYFKYAGFLAFNINALAGTHIDLGEIILPLGISFFTFQKLALLVDVYRGDAEDVRFFDYLVFVTFFPQLIAGPIVLFPEVHDQFREPGRLGVRLDNVMVGATIFAIGLAKKIVLADEMEHFATPVFKAALAGKPLTFVEGWTGALTYSFQLYFDFSAYSDMAIGLAWMFGIALPYNFNSPYKATSIIEFWRRWHVTLSRFLRVYLYIPLGGNRQGPVRRQVNLLAVMLLGGLWHGAAWTFVVWGAMHGTYLVINHLWRDFAGRLPSPKGLWPRRMAVAASWLLTFVAVVSAWVLFRADSFGAAAAILTAMFDPAGFFGVFTHAYTMFGGGFVPDANQVPQWLAGMLVLVLVMPNTLDMLGEHFPKVEGHQMPNRAAVRLRWRPNTAWAAFAALCLAVGILGLSRPQVFIYFQF